MKHIDFRDPTQKGVNYTGCSIKITPFIYTLKNNVYKNNEAQISKKIRIIQE